jgi:hypothetical protein
MLLEQTGNICPNCGANVKPEADICEVCHTWLLNGKCKFCYADINLHDAYCSECGNPRDGIQCPHCGSLSIFDFCINCGKPLTEGAQEALELAKHDLDAKALIDAVGDLAKIEADLATLGAPMIDPVKINPKIDPKKEAKEIAKRLEKEKRLLEAAAKKEAQRISKGLAEDKKQSKINAEIAKKAELVKKKQEALAAAKAVQEKLKDKQFSNGQDARRFHNAVKPNNVKGWRCNAYNNLHPDGPNGCAAPQHGGHWE